MSSGHFPRRALYLTSFLLASGGGMVFSLLGRLQDQYGFATGGLGLLTAATFIASPVANIALAPLGDRGRSRELVIAAISLGTAGALWFAFATHLWQFVLARTMIGFSFGMYQPAARALILRNAQVEGTGAGVELAKLSGVDTAGFCIGPAIGAILLSLLGLRAPFLFVAMSVPVTGLLLLTRLPRELTATDPDLVAAPVGQRIALDLLRIPTVRVAVLLAVGNFLPVGIYDSLWARYMQDKGASTLFVGLSLSMYGVPFVLAAARGGRFVDRVGPIRAIRLAMLGIVPLVFLYGVAPNAWAIAGIALVEATFGAVAQPAAQAAMASACPPDRLSAGQGLASAAASLTAAATALIAAPTYARIGSVGVFAGASVAIIAVMATAVSAAARLTWTGPDAPKETVG